MARTTPTVARNAVSSHLQVLVWQALPLHCPVGTWHVSQLLHAVKLQTPSPQLRKAVNCKDPSVSALV